MGTELAILELATALETAEVLWALLEALETVMLLEGADEARSVLEAVLLKTLLDSEEEELDREGELDRLETVLDEREDSEAFSMELIEEWLLLEEVLAIEDEELLVELVPLSWHAVRNSMMNGISIRNIWKRPC